MSLSAPVVRVLAKRSPAGPGIYPYGHNPNDLKEFNGTTPRFLGLFVPARVLQNEETTTRRFKYTPESDEHSMVRAYAVLYDLLRAFVEYRTFRRDDGEEDENGDLIRKKRKPRRNQVVTRREKPAQNVSHNSVVYLTQHIPHASSLTSDSDERIRQVWALPKTSHVSDAFGMDPVKKRLEELKQQVTRRESLASELLGDEDTGADESCIRFQNASFVGRLDQVIVLEEGTTSKDFYSFDGFCNAYIQENKYMQDQCEERHNRILLAEGNPFHDRHGSVSTSSTAYQSWLQVFGIDMSPSEVLLSPEDFLKYVRILDHNWNSVRPSATMYSAFFALRKQVNVLQRLDVPSEFKNYGMYVVGVGERPNLSQWPALTKRYLRNEAQWAQSQHQPLPVPSDISSYPHDKYADYYERESQMGRAELTPEERTLEVTDPVSLTVDPHGEYDPTPALVARDEAKQNRAKRRAFASQIGIGRSVEVVTDALLKERNDATRVEIQTSYQKLRASVSQQDPLREPLLQSIDDHERTEMLRFKRAAADEVARTIYHENGNESEENRAAAAKLKQLLLQHKGRINIGFHKHSSNLTLMGDFWAFLGLLLELIFDVCYTHDVIPILLESAWASSDPRKGLHPNILQTGDNEASKSFNFEIVMKLLIEATVDMVSDATRKAHMENKSRDAKIEVHEEANDAWFGVTKANQAGTTPELAAHKARLTNQVVIADHGWIDSETGQRKNVRTITSCRGVVWVNSNNITKYAKAALSRYIVFALARRTRPGHDVADIQTIDNAKREQVAALVRTKFTFLHALISATFMLIKCGVLENVATPVTEQICHKVRQKWKSRFTKLESIIRPFEMLYGLARAATVARALMIRFGSPDSLFYGYKFSSVSTLMQALVTLEPDLVDADPTICVHLLGLIPLLRSRFQVLEAIMALYFKVPTWCKNPNGDGLKVMTIERRGLQARQYETERQNRKKTKRKPGDNESFPVAKRARGGGPFKGPPTVLLSAEEEDEKEAEEKDSSTPLHNRPSTWASRMPTRSLASQGSVQASRASQSSVPTSLSPRNPMATVSTSPVLQDNSQLVADPVSSRIRLGRPFGRVPHTGIRPERADHIQQKALRLQHMSAMAHASPETLAQEAEEEANVISSSFHADEQSGGESPLAVDVEVGEPAQSSLVSPVATEEFPAERPCKSLCCCNECHEFRADYIRIQEKQLATVAQNIFHDDPKATPHECMVKQVEQEKKKRSLQYIHNSYIRQQRYLLLYDRVADANGENLLQSAMEQDVNHVQTTNADRNAAEAAATLDDYNQQTDALREEVAQRHRVAKEKVDLGVYYMAHDPFHLMSKDGSQTTFSPGEIFNKKMVSAIHSYMVAHSTSAMSKEAIWEQVNELRFMEVPAHHVRYPLGKEDPGLGFEPSPDELDSSEHQTIHALRIFPNGNLGLACGLPLNNVADPLRCILQEILEYNVAFPRSYLFGVHSPQYPYLYSTINVIPNPNQRFVTSASQQYPEQHLDTMQAMITGFDRLPSMVRGHPEAMDTLLQGQGPRSLGADASGPVAPPETPPETAAADVETVSMRGSMASFTSRELDMTLEDYEWMNHWLTKNWTPEQLLLLGSGFQSQMDERRIVLQNEYIQHQEEIRQDIYRRTGVLKPSPFPTFRVAPYPQFLLKSIRDHETKQKEEAESRRRNLHKDGSSSTIVTTEAHLKTQFPTHKIDAILKAYNHHRGNLGQGQPSFATVVSLLPPASFSAGSPSPSGRPLVPQGSPSPSGRPLVPQGSPSLSGQPLVPQGSPSLSGRPPVPQGSPSLSGRPLVPQGSPSPSCRPPVPQGSPSLSGRPLVPQGSPSLSGRPPVPQGPESPAPHDPYGARSRAVPASRSSPPVPRFADGPVAQILEAQRSEQQAQASSSSSLLAFLRPSGSPMPVLPSVPRPSVTLPTSGLVRPTLATMPVRSRHAPAGPARLSADHQFGPRRRVPPRPAEEDLNDAD
jgi:hypothetical protein